MILAGCEGYYGFERRTTLTQINQECRKYDKDAYGGILST
jgi:hypothetical protein